MDQAFFWLEVGLMGALGATVGRLLNGFIDYLPTKTPMVTPQLSCFACQKRLKWKGLVPILGYLQILGKCPLCGTPMPLRILSIEVLTALIYAYVTVAYESTLFPEGVVLLLYIGLLTVIATIDFECQIVLDKLVYPALPISLLLAPWGPAGFMIPTKDAYISACQSGGLAFLFFLFLFLTMRNRIGAGDVKLSLLLGLMMGFPLTLIGFQLGLTAGGLAALMLVALKRKTMKGELAFAPFLTGGSIIAMFWGHTLLNWYSKLIA